MELNGQLRDAFATAIMACARGNLRHGTESLGSLLTPTRDIGSMDVSLLRQLAKQYTGRPMGMEGFRRIVAGLFGITDPPSCLPAQPIARLFRAFDSAGLGELTWSEVRPAGTSETNERLL